MGKTVKQALVMVGLVISLLGLASLAADMPLVARLLTGCLLLAGGGALTYLGLRKRPSA